MIKLTDEQIKTICKTGGWDDSWQSVQFARAVEAEVLRLNGITDKCDGNHAGARCADPECWNDDPPGDRVYKSADELFDSLGIDTKPRATGCPDTMDDTGHFAEVDMPAFLRKQNPA